MATTPLPKIVPELDGLTEFFTTAEKVILGKQDQVKLALCAILSEGHVLLEDLPGVGKTTLVKLFAKALGLTSTRIQFTNDLLPADILGTSIFDLETREFRFHPGPIFGQLVIADELNRATPKTQSACLQAMEERAVTVDGHTYPLPKPFVVFATQNPKEQAGTYVLPESQLDRFMMRIELGFPDRKAERELLKGENRQILLEQMNAVLSPKAVLELTHKAQSIHVSDAIIDYIQNLLTYSRNQSPDQRGLSPRAGLALVRASKTWAMLHGRAMVLPDDVQAVGPAIMAHRLNRSDENDRHRGHELALEILKAIPVD